VETELPPVSNRLVYIYRIAAKVLSFFVFGLSSVILATLLFPVFKLLFHPHEQFQRQTRRFITASFRYFFVKFMSVLGIVEIHVDDRERFRHLKSKIVVPNHPSLLDVVMMISLIPNADCIVNGYLNHNILRGVVRQMYILNTLEVDELTRACIKSLERGNCLIIFPEGTRTRRTGEVKLQRGAAQLSLASGCALVPVHIGGTDKYGLGKHDPFLAFNHREKYVYDITMLEEVLPQNYTDTPRPIAARQLTEEIKQALFRDDNQELK
jgi:1-acyl-sn-glycerol-3-phosphate acyltransferase